MALQKKKNEKELLRCCEVVMPLQGVAPALAAGPRI